MIKVKLSDPNDPKNFSGLILNKDRLRDYSIELTTSNDYDYEFISQNRYLDLSVTLAQSIDEGLKYLSNKSGDYFLFHGADSTSLLGAYEVFSQCNAKALFKKQILSQLDYKHPAILNKWFFGTGDVLNVGYDIPNDTYSRIHLTGFNVGHNWPQLQIMQQGNNVRDIDVCAVYQTYIPRQVFDHEVRSDVLYKDHRNGAWEELEKINNKYNIIKGQSSRPEFIEIMKRSRIGISPFGMGELCYRDLELIQWGCLLIKPDMSKVITKPDFFKPMETYVPVNPDWSNLNEVIENILSNYKDYEHIIETARKRVTELYSYDNVCMHWYKFFANMSGISS